jgi:importin subunit beta-1
MKNAIGVLGDLAEAFPNGELKQPLSAEWVQDGLKAARSRGAGGSEVRRIAKWAREVCFFFQPLWISVLAGLVR